MILTTFSDFYSEPERRVDVIELKRFARVYKKPISYFLR